MAKDTLYELVQTRAPMFGLAAERIPGERGGHSGLLVRINGKRCHVRGCSNIKGGCAVVSPKTDADTKALILVIAPESPEPAVYIMSPATARDMMGTSGKRLRGYVSAPADLKVPHPPTQDSPFAPLRDNWSILAN